MFHLTDAQRITLQKMPRYHVVAQLHTGAVIVVCEQMYQNANVIDVDGNVFAFSRYLASLDRRT